MKKLLTFLTISMLAAPVLQSQISIGPRFGISNSKVKVEENFNNNGEQISYETADSEVGIHAGAFARIEVLGIYVQPELLFTSSGGKVKVESEDRGEEIWNLTYNKLDMPVMAGIKFLKILRVQAGPKFSLMLSSDARDIDVYENVENNYNQASVGYQAGIGIDISDIYIDLKYENNLSNVGQSISIGDQEFSTDTRNPLIMLIVGYNIL